MVVHPNKTLPSMAISGRINGSNAIPFGSRPKKQFQIRIQLFGTMSPSSFFLYHLFGAIITFSLFSESHAAHQLNELLAIMKCLHADISCKSSGALSGSLISTYVWGWLMTIFRLHHSGSSEKTKKSGLIVWSQIERIALL